MRPLTPSTSVDPQDEAGMNPSETLTAVLLDPHPLWLDAVETVLARVDIEVVGKTTVATTALGLVEEHQPDLLVTALELRPDPDGFDWLTEALNRSPGLKVIVLSMYDDPLWIDQAFAAGASAYVIKTVHPDDLTAAIRQAFDHSVYLAGMRHQTHPRPPAEEQTSGSPGLTPRELEILRLVAEGHSNGQLARMLWVTEQTVKFHLSNIYRKLGVANRTEASRWAHVNGLVREAAAPKTAA